MSELISIIVPVYDVELYLEKCVKSIQNQTYTNLEIILVDDGSPDRCPEICDRLADCDSRIKVIHKENGGLSDARNAGLDIARGNYISFIDSDDYISEQMFEKLHHRIQEDCSDIAVCNIAYIDIDGNILDKRTNDVDEGCLDELQFWIELYGTNYTYCVVAWNKLYRKELFDDIRYDCGKIHEDELIIHKIINKCERISFLKEKMYFYLQRNQSIMGKPFSIKRLDGSEASIRRSIYFFERGWQTLAELALIRSIGVIMKGYDMPNHTEVSWKRRIKELHKQFRRAYIQICSNRKASFRFRINAFTFYLSPIVYKVTHFMKYK